MLSIPYYPVSYYGTVPQYSVLDVEIFGSPDIYGIESFIVIDQPRYFEEYVPDQIDYDRPNRRLKPIHRYDRQQRFRATLRALLGATRDPIPEKVLYCFWMGEIDLDPTNVWTSLRNVLKKAGNSKYYNRIPEILSYHKYPYNIIVPKIDYQEMYRDFRTMHIRFNNNGSDTHIYFPNIRFIILKMLHERGVVFQYDIPLLQTKSKIPVLNHVWESLRS